MDEKWTDEISKRRQQVMKAVKQCGADGILLTSDVNIYYMSGHVISGYYYLPLDGEPVFFVKRPNGLSGERLFSIHKPEQIPEIFATQGWALPKNVLMETDVISYNECTRIQNVFQFEKIGNASALMRNVRMFKTPYEIAQLRLSAERHSATYADIVSCFRPGMTDLEFQAEIEHRMRLHGSIGVFRAYGSNMNIFMGSLLTGDNAETPSPFDFALGGGGQTAFCPIGANGTPLKEGMAIMVDMAGNYTDYLTDMTRVFSIGKLPEIAYKAHQTALEIQSTIESVAKSGVACADLYNMAYSIVEKEGLQAYFMGTKQQAKFVGHGIGLEINEPPVLTPRSKEILQPTMVFALEPKFVIPKVGAVGVENSFLVTETGVEKITKFEEQIISLI